MPEPDVQIFMVAAHGESKAMPEVPHLSGWATPGRGPGRERQEEGVSKNPKTVTTTKIEMDRPVKSQQTVEALFAQYQTAFKRVAAEGLDLRRMMQVAVMAMARSQDLLGCTAISLLGAFMQAAQMGLDLGMKEAYLVPFKNKYTKQMDVQLIPDYRGLIKLARNTGQIKDLWGRLVYKGEKFNVVEGDNPHLDHKPDYSLDRTTKSIVAAYTIATWDDNRMTFEVITRDKIERARKAAASESGPWTTDYDEMAIKTAIKHRCKTLPRSHQLVTALALDERAELGRPQNIELVGEGDLTLAQMGPDPPEDAPGQDQQESTVVLISGTQQGKALTWIKQYKWSETQVRQMLVKALPGTIDASAPTLQEVVCQIPDAKFEEIIAILEKGPGPASNGDEPPPVATPGATTQPEAPAKPAADRNPETEISDDEYNDLWAFAVEHDMAGDAQKLAKSLGYPKLRNVKLKDLKKIFDHIRKNSKKP